jgi:hypothetical protein
VGVIKTAIETVADLKKVLEQYPDEMPVVVKHGWHPVVFETDYSGKKCVAIESIIEHERGGNLVED